MTKAETAKVLAILYSEFPNEYKTPSQEEIQEKINVWATMFKEDESKIVNLAVYKLLSSCNRFPKISEVKAAIAECRGNHLIDGGEAWGEVISAIRKYGYMQEEKAINSMSPTTAMAVKYMGWQNICQSENANIQSAIESKTEQIKEPEETERQKGSSETTISAEVLKMIESTKRNMRVMN